MSSVSSSTGGLINFSGLASGIDTNSIIQGLTQLSQKHISDLRAQQTAIQTQQSTFSDLQSKLNDLQTQIQQLSSNVNGALGGHVATTSDSTALSAAASSSAQPGTYTVTVNSLAKAEQLASAGLASANATIQQGTFQIQVGSGTTTTVTIDSTNNTLQGLVHAINNAGGDVQASIVNDGTSIPYRLLLNSSKTGAVNTIQITNNLTTGQGASLNFNQTIQAASDAQLTLGTGSGALTFNSSSNTVSDAIAGVTLSLQKADPTKQLTLTVANDTTTAANAVQAFVTSYNAIVDDIAQNTSYDATTKKAGDLLGNTDVQQLQNTLQNALTGTVAGANPKANSLASIGITFDSSGHLQSDQSKLNQAISGQIPGVSVSDVQRLFGLSGASSSPSVNFLLGSSKTLPTGATPYQVNITQAATQGIATATTPLPSTINISASDNNFSLRVNTVLSSLLSIPAGPYTPSQLVAALQSSINADSQLGTNQVTVGLDSSGRLQIASTAYGNSSQVAFAGGTALGASSPLGFVGTESARGQNVQGSFTVNGKTEAATGIGQILGGNSGNANTDGLQLKVTLTPSQVGSSGSQSTLTVTAGIGTQLNQVLGNYLNPATGRLKSINDQFQATITDIGKQITTQNAALQTQTNNLVDQFSQMETTISNLKNIGAQLAAQLGAPATTTGPTAAAGS